MDGKDFISFTDTIINVPALSDAMKFYTFLLNFEYVESGLGWMAVEDRETGQRIVCTEEDFGSPWALSFKTENMESTKQILEEKNIKVIREAVSPGGFRFMLCHDNSGVPMLIYQR